MEVDSNGNVTCPEPFLNADAFNTTDGCEYLSRKLPDTQRIHCANINLDVPGRFCGDIGGVECCLPCPVYDWVWPDSFFEKRDILVAFSTVSMAACIILLLSWILFPPNRAHRTYLTIGLIFYIFTIDVST